MRYKVNCRVTDYTDYIVIYTKEDGHNEIELSLYDEDSQFENLIFKDGKIKVFNLNPEANVSTYNGSEKHFDEDYYISGIGKFPQIQLAMTIINGDIDVSVKPFSYSLDDIRWKVKSGDEFGDYELSDELKDSYWEDYLNPRFIENYFRSNITVEEVED